MKYRNHARACVLVLAVAAVALSGCTSIRKAAGLQKDTPDEFAVVTKAPLVIPPDYELRPPRPGAVPTNQTSPTGAAQAALYSDTDSANPDAVAGNYSEAEKNLLTQTGAATADHSIRQEIASDEKSMQGADEGFTDRVLFGKPDDSSDKAVDGNAVTQKSATDKAGAPAATPAPADTSTQPDAKPNDSAKSSRNSSDNGGWFSWLGL
jgi:hypothetical protein